jgi:hypothetical protein
MLKFSIRKILQKQGLSLHCAGTAKIQKYAARADMPAAMIA